MTVLALLLTAGDLGKSLSSHPLINMMGSMVVEVQ